MGLVLALDSSAAGGGTALHDGRALLGEVELDPAQRHAAGLVLALERLLAHAGVTLDAVDALALTIGPGSFTGLRIGLSTALGLAFGTSLRLAPVPTLAALALQAELAPGELAVPLLDAQRGEVYAGLYSANGEPILPEVCVAPAAWLAGLPADARLVLLGSGADRYGELFAASLGRRARQLAPELGKLRPRTVAAYGVRLRAEGKLVEPSSIDLRYLRVAEAEAKRLALHPEGKPIPLRGVR